MSGRGAGNTASLLARIAVLVFVLAYLLIGLNTLDATTRFVPVLAAGVTLLLVIADLLKTLLGRTVEHGDAAEGGGVSTEGVTAGRELAAIGLVAAGVAAVYFAGFLVAIPLYLFVSIAWLGKQPVRTALVVTLVTSVAIFLVFEFGLAYNLHRGTFFQ